MFNVAVETGFIQKWYFAIKQGSPFHSEGVHVNVQANGNARVGMWYYCGHT